MEQQLLPQAKAAAEQLEQAIAQLDQAIGQLKQELKKTKTLRRAYERSIRLDLGTRRFVNQPTYAFPCTETAYR